MATFAIFQNPTTGRYTVNALRNGVNCGPVGPTFLRYRDAVARCMLENAKADALCPTINE